MLPLAGPSMGGQLRSRKVPVGKDLFGSLAIPALTSPLRGDVNQISERAEPCESLALELPDALARQVELVADRLERPRLALEAEPQLEDPPLALGQRVERLWDAPPSKAPPRPPLEAEPQLEDPPLALGQRVERLANALPAKRLLGLLERVRGLAVGEEVAELALVVGADGLVERDRRLCGAEGLVDVLDR